LVCRSPRAIPVLLGGANQLPLGNLTKSFNYRAIASNDEKTLTLSEYIPHPETSPRGIWLDGPLGRIRPRFLKPMASRDQGDADREISAVPVKKTYTVDPQPVWATIDRPQNQAARAHALCLENDRRIKLGRAPLQYGQVRIFQEGRPRGHTVSGEDWGKFTPLMTRCGLRGHGSDVVVKRTIDKNEQSGWRAISTPRDRGEVRDRELQGTKAITLDISENIRAMRKELAADTGRDVQWELGAGTTFKGQPDKEKSTFEQVVFHVDLPAKRSRSESRQNGPQARRAHQRRVVTISANFPSHKEHCHEDLIRIRAFSC